MNDDKDDNYSEITPSPSSKDQSKYNNTKLPQESTSRGMLDDRAHNLYPDKKMKKENKIDYKFNEANTIAQIKRYVDGTYERHYGYGQYQATDMIIDAGHGEGFCIGNIMKYAMRYGKKNNKSQVDLLKIIHYTLIALYLNQEDCKDNDSR